MKSTAFAFVLIASLISVDCFASAKSAPHPSPSPSPSPSVTPSPSPSPTQTGPDPYMGTQLTTSAEYHLAATVDSQVLSTAKTEDWGIIYRPYDMGSTAHPVIIMLHGNHTTCGVAGSDGNLAFPIVEAGCAYTSTGQCNSGQAVIPNHLGYGYLANRLASFGYVVVSINTNLGINCASGTSGDNGLILARGRMILRHLTLLNQWNTTAGTTPSSLGIDLKGRLDLSQIGLFGHSRGGEGVRAAYNLWQSGASSDSHWKTDLPNIAFKAIFEIGPVDGMSSMTFNPVGTAWNVILPLCDGDVQDNEGMKPYDRSLAATGEAPALPKSMYAVWGANHDFYNTYWQSSDSAGCVGATPLWNQGDSSSGNQQETAIAAVIPFFRGHLGSGADPSLADVLNPSFAIPTPIAQITRIDRAYVNSPSAAKVTRVETFQGSAGVGSMGHPYDIQNITMAATGVPEHDASLKAASIQWNSAGSSVYFQDNWAANGSGLSLSTTATLDFRVSRAVDSNLNSSASTDFDIQLVNPDGSLGRAVKLSSYASLVGPVGMLGSGSTPNDLHVTLLTVRIPISDLGSIASARGVRFTFDSTATGNIFISDIDLSASVAQTTQLLGGAPLPMPTFAPLTEDNSLMASATQAFEYLARGPAAVEARTSGKILRIDRVSEPGAAGAYEVEVENPDGFRVRDALPVLKLNGVEVGVGSFPASGDLHTMTFQVNSSSVGSLPDMLRMEVGHRGAPREITQSLGDVSKTYFQQ